MIQVGWQSRSCERPVSQGRLAWGALPSFRSANRIARNGPTVPGTYEHLVGRNAVPDDPRVEHPQGAKELKALAVTVGSHDRSSGSRGFDDDVDRIHGSLFSEQGVTQVPVCESFRLRRPSRSTVFIVNDVSLLIVTVDRLRERPRPRTEHSPRIVYVPSEFREDSNRQPSRSTMPSPQ